MRCDSHVQAYVRDRVRVLTMLEEYHRLVALREKRESGHYRNPTVAWRMGSTEAGVPQYVDAMMVPTEACGWTKGPAKPPEGPTVGLDT